LIPLTGNVKCLCFLCRKTRQENRPAFTLPPSFFAFICRFFGYWLKEGENIGIMEKKTAAGWSSFPSASRQKFENPVKVMK